MAQAATVIDKTPKPYEQNPSTRSDYATTDNYATTPSPEDQAGTYAMGVSQGQEPVHKISHNMEEDPLSPESLIRLGNAYFSSADEHRKPREVIWDICWALYNNEFDWTDKAWWQHKAPIPKVRSAVDKAVALFRKTLLRMYPFYGVQSESKVGRTKGRYTMLLTDYHLDQSQVIEEMVDAFKVGLITSVAGLKIWWERVTRFKPKISVETTSVPTYEFGVNTGSRIEEHRKVELDEQFVGKLGIKALNPKNIWVIPHTNGRGIIERDECTLNELEQLAEEGIYDKDEIKRVREKLTGATPKSDDEAAQAGEGRVTTGAQQYLRIVDLWHFWCDIYDQQGRLIKPNANFTLACDRSICIRKCRPNPFFHRKPPHVLGTPYKIPFSTYNRGMVEDVAEIAKSIVQMANLVADGALYDAMKAFAVDADQLDDPSEAQQGIYPGKTFLRRSSQALAPNEELVQTVEVGKVPSESMNMIMMFERYFQEGSYINEWVGGYGGKGDRTLGEVNIKTQSALEGLDESARNLEVTLIEPSMTMVGEVVYQFQDDYMLERLMDNYPQVSMMLQQMSPEERYVTMVGGYSFKVRGLSMMVERQQRMGELKEILTLLSYLPGFLERLNPDATLEEILMPIGWDPRRLLIGGGGTGQVTTPGPGALPNPAPPSTPALPSPGMPTSGGPRTPMQRRNAQEGARYGGGTNNPVMAGAPGRGTMAMAMPQGIMPNQQQIIQMLAMRAMQGKI